jgi:hypothetical protein
LHGHTQGSGCSTAESTREADSSAVVEAPACALGLHNGVAAGHRRHAVPSVFDTCPMCGRLPVDPVLIEGQMACWTCTAACTVCGSPSVPGDGACAGCMALLNPVRELVGS